jgi:lipopolysaccharide biosynthesis regulator YciM
MDFPRTAALWQRAQQFDRAETVFAELADTASDGALRAGSLFHLAELARDTWRPDVAVALARRCLSVEPEHRAARALHDALIKCSPQEQFGLQA